MANPVSISNRRYDHVRSFHVVIMFLTHQSLGLPVECSGVSWRCLLLLAGLVSPEMNRDSEETVRQFTLRSAAIWYTLLTLGFGLVVVGWRSVGNTNNTLLQCMFTAFIIAWTTAVCSLVTYVIGRLITGQRRVALGFMYCVIGVGLAVLLLCVAAFAGLEIDARTVGD